MLKVFKRLFKNEEGQSLVEYGLIIALVAVFVVVGISFFGDQIADFFMDLGGWVGSWNTVPTQ